jgi:hypothetical protein
MKIAIKTKNIKEYKQATAFVYALGITYGDIETYTEYLNVTNLNNDYEDYPYILVDTENKDLDFSSDPSEYTSLIWIKDHDQIEKALTQKSFTMTLTNDYEATVTHDGIVVGCQTIDFDTFQELVDLVDEFNNQ